MRLDHLFFGLNYPLSNEGFTIYLHLGKPLFCKYFFHKKIRIMKTSRYFRFLFSAFILILFSQAVFAQSWNNYHPLHLNELELTAEQKKQLKEIDKSHAVKIQEIYSTPNQGEDNKEHSKNIKEQIKLLQIEKENAQKVVLTAEQINQFDGYILEKKAEQIGNNLTRQKNRFESDYLGVFLTHEQNLAIYNKTNLIDNNIKWDLRKNKIKAIYKEVLTEGQLAIVLQVDQEKKEAREEKTLNEIKKGLTVAEGIMPLAKDFTLPKMITLRKKLDAKISNEDKRTLEELRAFRKISFDEVLSEGLEEIEIELRNVDSPELLRYLEFTKDLVLDNEELISNVWAFSFFATDENSKLLNTLADKYQNEIDALENELLYVIKETAKKGAIIASSEYPVPPVALWIDEIKLDNEIKRLFLLLDPTDDFSFDVQSFDVGEGQHIASVFPNPASRNQTLQFNTQQEGKVTIEIINNSGKVVKVISSENRMKGNQKMEVNIQELNSQIYFYRISSDEGVTLIKFSVVR